MRATPKIGVIGGGVFGCTAAARLAEQGYETHLFEADGDLLQAASGINQYRLHRGYHYPRCLETATASRDGEHAFRREYGEAVIDSYDHHYAIAHEDSLTSAEDYRAFLAAAELEHETLMPEWLNGTKVALAIRAQESLFDPNILRRLVRQRLARAGVQVHLRTRKTVSDLTGYDFVVVATYAALNDTLGDGHRQREYQFEVCEKPVVQVPDILRNQSIVVMDGPFMCIDPLGADGLAVMGNVVHALHHTHVGCRPEVPEAMRPDLDSGIVSKPARSKFDAFVEAAAEFIPPAADVKYVGSMFTVRTVLPRVDATDSRPTLVDRVGPRVVTLFSGKIGTCVDAAAQVTNIVKEELGSPTTERATQSLPAE